MKAHSYFHMLSFHSLKCLNVSKMCFVFPWFSVERFFVEWLVQWWYPAQTPDTLIQSREKVASNHEQCMYFVRYMNIKFNKQVNVWKVNCMHWLRIACCVWKIFLKCVYFSSFSHVACRKWLQFTCYVGITGRFSSPFLARGNL